MKFDHLTIDDGLSSNNVNCIFQDSRGFMWFGTEGGLAKSLFISLKSKVETGKPIFLVVSVVNQSAVALAKSCNMKVPFETARIYKKDVTDMPLDRIFGVTSFEIG